MTDDIDVPSPIDFSDPEQARRWLEDATIKRPWRPDFFQAFVNEIRPHLNENATIIELGSGPGLLAPLSVLANRALIATLLHTFARLGAAVRLKIGSCNVQGRCMCLSEPSPAE
jgi:hypothetical protein